MRTILILLLLTRTAPLFSQPTLRWPEDTARARDNVALYTDALRNQEYAAGREPLRWLLEQAPDLHKSLYIRGEKLYGGLIAQTKDSALRQQYQSEALELYDLRRAHFGEDAKVLNRQAHAAYRFYRKNEAQYAPLLKRFDRLYDREPSSVSGSNLLAHMDVVRLIRRARDTLSDEAVLRRYDRISEQLRECKQGKQQTADRAVYWAAYEMYRRAGRTDLMQQAQEQFLTEEVVFLDGYEEGQKIQIDCWIGEAVTVPPRDLR